MAVWSVQNTSSLVGGLRIDPEYYQPRYTADAGRLARFTCLTIDELSSEVTDGIHGSPDEVEEGGVRYLSAKCVKDNDFVLGDALEISDEQNAKNPRTQLRVDDVLITTVGTIGNAAVVQPDIVPANADRHLGIVRIRDSSPLDAYYVAAFLNSEYGRFQSLRESTGNVQLNLFIEKIRELRVPLLRCRLNVSALTRAAYGRRLEAVANVARAEELTVAMLGMSHVDLSPSKTYVRPMSDLNAAGRLGAEFFMPCKHRVMEALAAVPHKPLSTYARNVREMWNPANAPATEQVCVFDLSHALEPFLDDRQDPVDAGTVGSTKKRMVAGDVVVSRLRSYLKEIAVVRAGGAVPSVGSSEFIVLRPTGDLRPEALLAFLRSNLVQTVLDWSQDGTNHPRFDEDTLMALPVPDAVVDAQDEVVTAVGDGIAARQSMLALLAEAKSLIETEVSGEPTHA